VTSRLGRARLALRALMEEKAATGVMPERGA
jgi:hypothetical protein